MKTEMTIHEMVRQVNLLMPNSFEHSELARWLAELDRELLDTFKKWLPEEMQLNTAADWAEDEDDSRRLLLGERFPQLYRYWLGMQISLWQSEGARYTNFSALYNASMLEADAWVKRNFVKLEGAKKCCTRD